MGITAENYYDILNVCSDCSDKEIKEAYVKLSKKFHPDVKSQKNDLQQTASFLKISEAYQTLSKPRLRIEYDRTLEAAQYKKDPDLSIFRKNKFQGSPWEIKLDYDPNPGPYYGIKGLNKTTNSKVAVVLLLLGIFGATIGFVSVKHSYSLNQKRLDDVSFRATEHYQKIRSEVEKYSKDEQLRRVVDRITGKTES